MKQVYHLFFLSLCIVSLSNCRRGGGMMGGGGPMEGAGPCPRCNQNRLADDNFRRERIDPFNQDAPFPNNNANLNQDFTGNLVGTGDNVVQDENLLGGTPGAQQLQGLFQPRNPATSDGTQEDAVEAPALHDEGSVDSNITTSPSPVQHGQTDPQANPTHTENGASSR